MKNILLQIWIIHLFTLILEYQTKKQYFSKFKTKKMQILKSKVRHTSLNDVFLNSDFEDAYKDVRQRSRDEHNRLMDKWEQENPHLEDADFETCVKNRMPSINKVMDEFFSYSLKDRVATLIIKK